MLPLLPTFADDVVVVSAIQTATDDDGDGAAADGLLLRFAAAASVQTQWPGEEKKCGERKRGISN